MAWRWVASALCIPVLLAFGGGVAQADLPCALNFWPHLFSTGFENGNLDGFIRTPSGGWAPGNNNTAIESQDLGPTSWCRAWIITGFNWTDHLLQASVQYKSGVNECGLIYHFQDPNNYYLFTLSAGTTATLSRCVSGVIDRTQATSFAYLPDRWYVLRIEVSGAVHRASVNGLPVLEWTDSIFTRGTGGLAARGTRAWFDNVTSLIRPLPPVAGDHIPSSGMAQEQ